LAPQFHFPAPKIVQQYRLMLVFARQTPEFFPQLDKFALQLIQAFRHDIGRGWRNDLQTRQRPEHLNFCGSPCQRPLVIQASLSTHLKSLQVSRELAIAKLLENAFPGNHVKQPTP
jgi:hypothetical protein